MNRSAVTFCPENQYEIERLFAFNKREGLYSRIIVLALPDRMSLAAEIAARHPKEKVSVCEYPVSERMPNYYDPAFCTKLSNDLKMCVSESDGIVLVSDNKASFAFMNSLADTSVKPFYNFFQILHKLKIKKTFCFSMNVLEEIKMAYLLDDFKDVHKGERCFIAGNGPSLKQIDIQKLRKEITFGSNRVYLGFKDWGFNFKYWGIVDNRQIECYPEEWEDNIPEDMVKFIPFEYTRVFKMNNSCPVNTFNNTNYSYPHNFINPAKNKQDQHSKFIFSTDTDVVYLGWTVTYMLLQIAVAMGCNPIYLVGLDHKYNISKTDRTKGVWKQGDRANHFHAKYGVDKSFNLPDEVMMEKFFDHAFEFCCSRGIKVYNATPETALKSFPLVDYSSLFNDEDNGCTVEVTEDFTAEKNKDSRMPVIYIYESAEPEYQIDTVKYYLDQSDPNLVRAVNDVLDSHSAEMFALAYAAEKQMAEGWLGALKTTLDENSAFASVPFSIDLACNTYIMYTDTGVLVGHLTDMRFSEYFSGRYFIEDYCLRAWDAGYEVFYSKDLPADKVRYYAENRSLFIADKAWFINQWHSSRKYEKLYDKLVEDYAGKLYMPDISKISGHKAAADEQVASTYLIQLLVRDRIIEAGKESLRLIVFGAGKHTRWLEKLFFAFSDMPEVDYVIDDNSEGKDMFFGKAVENTSDFRYQKGDMIILSSDCYQLLMADRCRQLYGQDIMLKDLYSGLPPGPHDKG